MLDPNELYIHIPYDVIYMISIYCQLKEFIRLIQLDKKSNNLPLHYYTNTIYNHEQNGIFLKKYFKYIIKFNIKASNEWTIGSEDSIKNKFVLKLINVKYLILPYNRYLTNYGLKNLSNIHTLDLSHNTNITNNGLKYLPNIQILKLNCNKNITDEGLKYLKKYKNFRLMLEQ